MNTSSARSRVLSLTVLALYLFLYIPIAVLVIFSFNASAFPYVWKGFSLTWYAQLWESVEVWDALRNSFIVAISSVFLSLTMGVLLVYYGARTWLSRMLVLFYGSLAAPEIVIAVGLLSFFLLMRAPLGLTSLIAGHTMLGLGYVVPMVQARFDELDYALTEASYDLGATRTQTFFKIILPLLSPALFGAALLVFIISWDDFLISFFCAGAGAQTLPMYIFSMIRSGTTPVVNALSTIMLVMSALFVMVFSLLNVKRVTGQR